LRVLNEIFKLNDFKEFVKRFIIINLVAIALALFWIGIVEYKFNIDYENDVVTETGKYVYSDIVFFTPYLKNSSMSYLIKLDNGTYVYIPYEFVDELFSFDEFDTEEKHQHITVEYDPKRGYSYELKDGTTIETSMLVSLQGNKKVYFDKSDYIELCDSLKAEYYIGFFLIIGVGYLFFIILCASVPFFSVRRIIIQNKKRKIKRAKREAYRKKHSETEDSPASSNKTPN